jgi:hypothetical protein
MRQFNTSMIAVSAIVAACVLSAPQAWAASGSPGPGTIDCFVNKAPSSKQALRLTGTLSMEVTDGLGTTAESVDVIVRLQEKSGAPQFFRLHFVSQVSGISNNGELACYVFNPNHTNDTAVQAAVNTFLSQVRTAFQITSTTSQFQLVGAFDSQTQTWDTHQAVYNDEAVTANRVIPGTGTPGHAGSLADFTVYAGF